jgi:hypothetical protein
MLSPSPDLSPIACSRHIHLQHNRDGAMEAVNLDKAADELRELRANTEDQADRNVLSGLGDAISVGNISASTGIAIGRNIRQVINKFELSPDAVAALLDLREKIGGSFGIDVSQYQFGVLLAERTRNFVGRGYVFDAIDQFIQDHPSGYFVVHGPPGLGKSALLAEYVRRTGCIAHFNSRGLGVTNAVQFIQNICAQLIADTGLPYAELPAKAVQDGAFLLKILQEAKQRLPPDEQLVIAVDALDEAADTGQPDGANILFLPTVLPDGVYFVMTRRDAEITMVTQSPIDELDLKQHPAENRSDIEAYLRKALERPRLRAWIAARPLAEPEFVTALAGLSESNFMYLLHVLPEIESGAYANLDIKQLPVGLIGYYDDHWIRMGMTVKPLPRVKLRLIYILSEARKPVSRQLMSEFATDAEMRIDELDVQEVLDEWEQFLLEDHLATQPRYSVYHSSFRDFLHRKDIVQAAGLTIEGINMLIADNLWTSIFDG